MSLGTALPSALCLQSLHQHFAHCLKFITPAPPSESVSGTASTGDDVIAAPTVPKSGTSYSFRYQNVLILPGTDATATLGSITEDPEIADSVETNKKGIEVTTRSYTFSNFVIYARLDADGRYIISRIILSNRNSVTPEGIGIGSNAEDVLKTYGAQYTDNGNSITYSSGRKSSALPKPRT